MEKSIPKIVKLEKYILLSANSIKEAQEIINEKAKQNYRLINISTLKNDIIYEDKKESSIIVNIAMELRENKFNNRQPSRDKGRSWGYNDKNSSWKSKPRNNSFKSNY